MAAALRDMFDLTILANRDVGPEEFRRWCGLDLSGCPVKVVPIPFYDERNLIHLDPALVGRADETVPPPQPGKRRL